MRERGLHTPRNKTNREICLQPAARSLQPASRQSTARLKNAVGRAVLEQRAESTGQSEAEKRP